MHYQLQKKKCMFRCYNQMIEQNRIAYENSANFLPNWKTINKNELVNKYVEYEKKNKELAEHYLSAIICRYWHNIYKYYNKGSKLNPLEDYYEWVLEAILKCLNKKYWLNPKAKISHLKINMECVHLYNPQTRIFANCWMAALPQYKYHSHEQLYFPYLPHPLAHWSKAPGHDGNAPGEIFQNPHHEDSQ